MSSLSCPLKITLLHRFSIGNLLYSVITLKQINREVSIEPQSSTIDLRLGNEVHSLKVYLRNLIHTKSNYPIILFLKSQLSQALIKLILIQSIWHDVWIIRKQEEKVNEKLFNQQKPMSLLLAQKESWKERGFLDLNPYRKGNPHFRKGDGIR